MKAAAAGCPVWAVTQGFNWGIMHIIHRGGKEKFEDYIEPTEEDMRSMALLSAIEGAEVSVSSIFRFRGNRKCWTVLPHRECRIILKKCGGNSKAPPER